MAIARRHIFISYAREDFDAAQRLYQTLKQFGLPVWMDMADLIAGQDWQAEIRNAIRSCSCFLLLLSHRSITKRGFVQKEIREAMDIFLEVPPGEIFLIPVRLEECEPSDERIKRLQWVDLFPSWEMGLQRLLTAVSSAGKYAGTNRVKDAPADLRHAMPDLKYVNPAASLAQPPAFVDSLLEQLRLGGLVQRDFLPSHLPNSEDVRWAVAFLPAQWVSGDIYDIARINERDIGFYVADAVGYSVPAALLTIFIKASLRMSQITDRSHRVLPPCEVLKSLNEKMAGQKLSGYQFVTCCYCLLDRETLQLTFARGGHPYPILLRKGQPPRQLEARGSLLGVFENAEFVQQTVQLEKGDRLLLYSDGAESLIGRLHDKEGFQYTDEFLALTDSPITEIVDRLTEMATHREPNPAEIDDLTIVGLQLL